MRPPNTDTHQACRSLLQKTIRRGYVSLAKDVILHLDQIGDRSWLKQRTSVIIFEECWPLASNLKYPLDIPSIILKLEEVSKTIKTKGAAGLGSLAHAYSKGDTSVLSGNPSDKAIMTINKAIGSPPDFWNWVESECIQDDQYKLIQIAKQAYRKGGWPWDKAFMLAAAYLTVTDGIPVVDFIPPSSQQEKFPFWVALDKHTPQGKDALSKTAKQLGKRSNQVMWASFYFESATTNQEISSVWWQAEKKWRLRKMGLSIEKAELLWEEARPIVYHILKENAEWLEKHIQPTDNNPVQLSLF